jgi:hypothetical protein
VLETEPLLGALGSAGAIAKNRATAGSRQPVVAENGWVVSVYCPPTAPTYQLTGSGVTVVGGAEKVPVATNALCVPFVVGEMVMDCSRRLLPQLRAKQANARTGIKGDARRAILIATPWCLRALRQLRSCLPNGNMTPAEVDGKDETQE